MTDDVSRDGWFSGLRRGILGKPEREMPPPQPARPVFAIGDIHGRLDLVEKLLRRIEDHVSSRGVGSHDIVFLGDYVDRGPSAAAVVHHLMHMQSTPDRTITCLQGNHEDWLLGALEDEPRDADRWLTFGGRETLRSFGVSDVDDDTPESDKRLIAEAHQRIPAEVLAWIAALPRLWQSGNVVAVHAMLDPALPVDAQDPHTLIWGRPSKFHKARTDGIWFVHGHSITRPAIVDRGRIAIDTGAYFSETLTAAVIMPGQPVAFLDTLNGLTSPQ